MTLYLVRHAMAGSRHAWGRDDDRPLSASGARQAEGIARSLGDEPIAHVMSSPSRRCLETVAPLASTLGLDVEPEGALAEDAADDDVVALVSRLAGCDAVLCTHANIVPVVLDHLRRTGTSFGPGPHDWKRASVWVLRTGPRGTFTDATYLPPPR